MESKNQFSIRISVVVKAVIGGLLVLLVTMLFIARVFGSEAGTGSIRGTVVESGTLEPLIGVNVMLENTEKGAATDNEGNYGIENLAAGSYTVIFRYIGFKTAKRTDVQVRPDRITTINAELTESAVEGKEVVVTTGYFNSTIIDEGSAINFNTEEIRRSPGSGGDVSRILMALPSTAQVYDNSNDIMVRGGSPMENAFYVDNIRIANINHFPTQGATGGAIGMLNVDFIDDVTFSSGGFSAAYGDRLSSVVDIKFREGNREEPDLQLDMNMSGFGGSAEGPLGQNGSWLLSGRRSYLDLIVGAIGTGSAPRYGDIQGKIAYNLNSQHRISLLNIMGTSQLDMGKAAAETSDNPSYGTLSANQQTTGLTWRYLWDGNGYSTTSLSYGSTSSDDAWYDIVTDESSQASTYNESTYRLRNENVWKIDAGHQLKFGLEAAYETADYDYYFAPYTNRLGNEVPSLTVKDSFHGTKIGLFASYQWIPAIHWEVTGGLRMDYFSFTRTTQISPRLSVAYHYNDRVTFTGATGVYYQTLPMFILSQEKHNRELSAPRAIHLIAGIDYLLSENTKLSLTAYDKEYDRFPLEPEDPTLFVVDDGRHLSYFRRYTDLRDTGKAYSRGVEILLQKKLAKDFYGLVSATWFRSRYRDLTGEWRNRTYDNRWLFSIIGGYKPNEMWEMSIKWTYAGGVPYSPFDQDASRAAKTGIIDQSQINTDRYPDYHSLNVRVDRRFFFKHSSLVAYMSIWNAYNRKNVAMYYWNETTNKQSSYYQWSLIPIGGIEWEF